MGPPGAGTFSHGGLRARLKGTVPSASAAIAAGLGPRPGDVDALGRLAHRASVASAGSQLARLGRDRLALEDLAVAGGEGVGEGVEVLLGAELAARAR